MTKLSAEGRILSVCESPFRPEKPELTLVLREASIYVQTFSAERLDLTGKPTTGGYLIAMDAIGTGHGETVLILDEGTGARQILDDSNAPVRSIVVGIVGAVELESN